jgi:hypothetical protein
MEQVLTVLATVALGLSLWGAARIAISSTRLRSPTDQAVEEGPIPGYAYYPGRLVTRSAWMDSAGLVPSALEAFHGPSRTRVVLTLAPSPGHGFQHTSALLQRAAGELLDTTGAHVAVVEIATEPLGPSRVGDWTAVASRDGRGWSGLETDAWMVIEAPPNGGTT